MSLELKQLLEYNDIVIQCHDNPDADAIASGYALLKYLHKHGKDARFVYGGRFEIQKSNLVKMVETLHIPIEYVTELDKPELLVTVDCQYMDCLQTQMDLQKSILPRRRNSKRATTT